MSNATVILPAYMSPPTASYLADRMVKGATLSILFPFSHFQILLEMQSGVYQQ